MLATALYSLVSTPSLLSMKRHNPSNKHIRVQTIKERDQEESSAPGFRDLLSSTTLTYLHMSTHRLRGRLEQPDRRLHELRSGVDGLVLAERVQLEIHHRLLRLLALCLHLWINAEIHTHLIQTQIHTVAHTPLIPATDPLLYGSVWLHATQHTTRSQAPG